MQWTPASPPVHNTNFRILFTSATAPAVELLTGDAGWVVYATLNSTGDPANIASISTPAADNFVVQVVNPEGGPGAANVGQITLEPTSSSNYANLAGGEIAGDLTGGLVLQRSSGGAGGTLTGLLQINGAIGGDTDIPIIDGTAGGWLQVLGDAMAGADLTVSDRLVDGGQLSIYGDVPSTATIVVNDLLDTSRVEIALLGTCYGQVALLNGIPDYAAVVLGKLDAPGVVNLTGDDVEGSLGIVEGGDGAVVNGGVIRGAVNIPHYNVHGPQFVFSGTAEFAGVTGTEESIAYLSLLGIIAGEVTIAGDIGPYVEMDVVGDVTATGRIRAHSALAESYIVVYNSVFGVFELLGDLDGGSILIVDAIDGEGRLVIHGSLYPSSDEPIVVAEMGPLAAVVIDYDGWDDGDDWVSGATVQVGTSHYTENTPAARVWEIQPCRGDMNNDGEVNAFDIDPFILALSDPEGYQEEFPGLEASRVYHGDCDCDTEFNNFDIDPFVARVITNECDATCGDSLTGGGGQSSHGESAEAPTAADVATLLRDSVASDRQTALLTIVATAAGSEDTAAAAFWSDVLARLVE
ncbi:MAG: hypothetical protein AB7Q17_15895 [Phycisphaerae bacterium]